MTPEERRQGAFEQFDELLYEGMTVPEAIMIVASDNELKPENFQAFAERLLGDLETYREKMMLRADHEQVESLARGEIAKCLRREGPYKSIRSFTFRGAEEAIVGRVEGDLGRGLTKHEIWTIEDMWDEAHLAGLEIGEFLRESRKRLRDLQRSRA